MRAPGASKISDSDPRDEASLSKTEEVEARKRIAVVHGIASIQA